MIKPSKQMEGKKMEKSFNFKHYSGAKFFAIFNPVTSKYNVYKEDKITFLAPYTVDEVERNIKTTSWEII